MFKNIFYLFISWKFYISISAVIASYFLSFNKSETVVAGDFLHVDSSYLNWIWANFDGVNYLYILIDGYKMPNFAFFPLLPLLIYIVNKAFSLNLIVSGLYITNLALFLSLFLIYKITLLDFNKKIANLTLIFLLIFPLSFFYNAVYADSLYLLLSVSSFYFARKSNWLLAGILGYFACLSRLVGIILLPILFIEWYIQQNQNKPDIKILWQRFVQNKAFFLFIIPLGTITYSLYLQINHGDFLLFQKSMSHWNQENLVFPLQTFFRYVKIIIFSKFHFQYFVAVFELISTLFYLALSFYVFKKIRASYGLLMFLTFLIPTFTGTFQSMPRYILHTFPAFIGLALIASSSKKIFIITLITFLILQFILIALFTRGYFIA